MYDIVLHGGCGVVGAGGAALWLAGAALLKTTHCYTLSVQLISAFVNPAGRSPSVCDSAVASGGESRGGWGAV